MTFDDVERFTFSITKSLKYGILVYFEAAENSHISPVAYNESVQLEQPITDYEVMRDHVSVKIALRMDGIIDQGAA